MPVNYVHETQKLEKFLMDNYQGSLKLLSLTGSAAYGSVIENVSDLDFLILLDQATPDDYRKIFTFKNSLAIKVDMIIISMRQLEHLYLDYNSVYYLYLIKQQQIKPIFMADDLEITVNKKALLIFTKNVLSLNIRTLKRIVYDSATKDTYQIIKYASYVVKNYLIINGIYPKDIKSTFEVFYNMSAIKMLINVEQALKNELNKQDFDLLLEYVDQIINYMDIITTEHLMIDEEGNIFETV